MLLTMVLHLAAVWATATPEFTIAVPLAAADRSRHIADAVRHLLDDRGDVPVPLEKSSRVGLHL